MLPGQKLVVSKRSLDKWVAEGVGLNLNDFPCSRQKLTNPEAEQVFDLLKADYIGKLTSKQK